MAFQPVEGLPDSELVNDRVLANFEEDPEKTRERLGETLARDIVYDSRRELTQSEIDFLVTVRPYTAVNMLMSSLSDEHIEWMVERYPWLMLTEEDARKRLIAQSPELFKRAVELSPAGALEMEYNQRMSYGRGYFSRDETLEMVVADPYFAFSYPMWGFLYAQGMLGSAEVDAVARTNPGALLQAPDLVEKVALGGHHVISRAVNADPGAGFKYMPDHMKLLTNRKELALRAPEEALRYAARSLDDETFEACFAAVAELRGYQLQQEPKEQSRIKVHSRATSDSLNTSKQHETASSADLSA